MTQRKLSNGTRVVVVQGDLFDPEYIGQTGVVVAQGKEPTGVLVSFVETKNGLVIYRRRDIPVADLAELK